VKVADEYGVDAARGYAFALERRKRCSPAIEQNRGLVGSYEISSLVTPSGAESIACPEK
jgi:hypothetical protein